MSNNQKIQTDFVVEVEMVNVPVQENLSLQSESQTGPSSSINIPQPITNNLESENQENLASDPVHEIMHRIVHNHINYNHVPGFA